MFSHKYIIIYKPLTKDCSSTSQQVTHDLLGTSEQIASLKGLLLQRKTGSLVIGQEIWNILLSIGWCYKYTDNKSLNFLVYKPS